MKSLMTKTVAVAAMTCLLKAGSAHAGGNLYIYNRTNYTMPGR